MRVRPAPAGELNRINVFPVPDGDTGTNLSLTLRTVADHLRANHDPAVGGVAREAARAAVLGARGNCGMILSHFLLGFADRLGERERMDPPAFADAMEAAVDGIYQALEHPVEGTILTVMRAAAEAAREAPCGDFTAVVERLVERARAALARTPDLLPALRRAGVVDAGAKGFVALLEGVLLLVRGDPLVAEAPPEEEARGPAAAAAAYAPDDPFRFCTEALVRGQALPGAAEVKARLRESGGSLVVVRSGDALKVHIHTDDPARVFAYLRELGELATHKAEDMHVQHEAVVRSAESRVRLARRPVTVVTDSACDLPEAVVRAHGIQVTPLLLVDGDDVYRDGVDVTAGAFHRRLRDEAAVLPTTSQPAPADFLETYARAAEDGEEVLGVLLGSSLSGTFGAAQAAAARFQDAPVYLVDTLGASLLQGLLVLKAAELAELGTPPESIVAELGRIRARSGILFTVDVFDRLLASGRVGKARAWLGTLLRVKPILELTPAGEVEAAGRVLGRAHLLEGVLDLLEARIPDPSIVRFGVVHVAAPEVVARVTAALRARFGDVEVLSGPATPVIATHLGVGAWAVAYLVEEA